MLKISIDLFPSDGPKPRRLDVMRIYNTADHPDSPRYGNYIAEATYGRGRKKIRIKDFDRQSSTWELIKLAIEGLQQGIVE